jgi:hypothetical protein
LPPSGRRNVDDSASGHGPRTPRRTALVTLRTSDDPDRLGAGRAQAIAPASSSRRSNSRAGSRRARRGRSNDGNSTGFRRSGMGSGGPS